MRHPSHEDSRRDFIRGSSWLLAGAVPAALAHASAPAVASAQPLRIGLIGCGQRGRAAAGHALASQHAQVQLVAIADLFDDRLQQASRALKSKFADKYMVDSSRRFSGLDGYRQLLDTDVDLVILATAPIFRPTHVAAAVQAGKHLFAEKPIAVDAAGVRGFLEACGQARYRELAVAVGFQRRHMASYIETIERLRQGAIGQLTSAMTRCNRPAPREQPRQWGQSEFEYQLRNWQVFDWAGGGSLVEEQVQNLDVINWLVEDHPLEARPLSDLQASSLFPDVSAGDAVEYTYRSGFRLSCLTRSTGQPYESSQWVYGSEGSCDLARGKIFDREQRLLWRTDASRDGYQAEFDHLLSSLGAFTRAKDKASGHVLQLPAEGRYAAESTLTAIMGRTALATAGRVRWGDCFSNAVPAVSMLDSNSLDIEQGRLPNRLATPVT